MRKIVILLSKIPHHKKVLFALYCCNDIKHIMFKKSAKSLELLEKWLEDNESVSIEELRADVTAVNNYYAFANDVMGASAQSYAAYAIYAAVCCVTTTHFDYASDSAAYAVDAAREAASKNGKGAKINENKLAQYEMYLLKMIEELTPLEKEFI